MSSEAQQNRYAPPEAHVSDVASAEGDTTPASRAIRFGAAMIDGVISIAVALPVIIAAFSAGAMTNPAAVFDPAILFGVSGLISLVGCIALIVVTIVLVHRNGQTIGKKLVGVKVVRSDGSRASLGRIFWLRNVVNAIPGMIPLVGNFYVLVDHLFIFTEKRQCLHDKIADTIVVTA